MSNPQENNGKKCAFTDCQCIKLTFVTPDNFNFLCFSFYYHGAFQQKRFCPKSLIFHRDRAFFVHRNTVRIRCQNRKCYRIGFLLLVLIKLFTVCVWQLLRRAHRKYFCTFFASFCFFDLVSKHSQQNNLISFVLMKILFSLWDSCFLFEIVWNL